MAQLSSSRIFELSSYHVRLRINACVGGSDGADVLEAPTLVPYHLSGTSFGGRVLAAAVTNSKNDGSVVSAPPGVGGGDSPSGGGVTSGRGLHDMNEQRAYKVGASLAFFNYISDIYW